MTAGVQAEQIAEGLAFPEGPVWADGVLCFTEIAAGRLNRWTAERGVERIAELGGGPPALSPCRQFGGLTASQSPPAPNGFR